MKISEANKLRLLYFLVFCCTASWLPLFADYCKDKGLSGIKIGIIISIIPLMMFLVQPFYGMLADRLGYKKCFLLSFAFSLNPDKEKQVSIDTQSFKNVKDVFRNKTLIFLLLCVFFISAGTSAIWYFYSTYMKENGASASLVGHGLSFQGLYELPFFIFLQELSQSLE